MLLVLLFVATARVPKLQSENKRAQTFLSFMIRVAQRKQPSIWGLMHLLDWGRGNRVMTTTTNLLPASQSVGTWYCSLPVPVEVPVYVVVYRRN
jgi:hypothetical protein